MIERRVQAKLDEIEGQFGVRILYAVESGSRAWGFASQDSDYDVRFIYVGAWHDYARIDPKRDVIELPLERDPGGDLDINGWDLMKALTLFRKSNPPLLEWLRSPILYRERGDLALRLREMAVTHSSPRRMAYHYISMAKQNYLTNIGERAEAPLKKYLYVLRPLAAVRWLFSHPTPPPTSFPETLAGIALPEEIQERIEVLIAHKSQGVELGVQPVDPLLNLFIVAELEMANSRIADLPDPEIGADLLNRLFWSELDLP